MTLNSFNLCEHILIPCWINKVIKPGRTKMSAKGIPSVNQNPKPWAMSDIQNIGKRVIWVYPKTWKYFILIHFIEVIAIVDIQKSRIIPVIPGRVWNKSSQYVGTSSNLVPPFTSLTLSRSSVVEIILKGPDKCQIECKKLYVVIINIRRICVS